MVIGFLVAILIAVETALLFSAYNQKAVESQENAAAAESNAGAAQAGDELAKEVLAACAAQDAQGEQLRAAGLCAQATDTKQSIEEQVTEPTDTPQDGRDGRDATTAQVDSAVTRALPVPLGEALTRLLPREVASYCAARNDCTPAPVPGRDGRDGVDGETPSDERLIALIAPLIPAPVPGPPGADGTNGVGVVRFDCSSTVPVEFTFTVTLDNGTSQTFTCGGVPVEPEPPAPTLDPVPTP